MFSANDASLAVQATENGFRLAKIVQTQRVCCCASLLAVLWRAKSICSHTIYRAHFSNQRLATSDQSLFRGRVAIVGRAAFLIVWALCLSLAGCASLNPHNWHWPTSHRKKAKSEEDRIPSPEPPGTPTAQRGTPNKNNTATGVLAGQVIDGLDQRRSGAVILVSASDAPQDPPQEILANDQGYFVIQGLQPGRRYKLTAQLKQGSQVLSGTTIATPPNVVLHIKLGEDFATAEAPPARPGKAQESGKTPKASLGPIQGNEKSWSPNAASDYLYQPDHGSIDRIAPKAVSPQPGSDSNGARLGAPERNAAPRQPNVGFRPELIGSDEAALKRQPPKVEINGNSTAANGAMQNNSSASGVPSCTLTADRVLDFTLTDLNGQSFSLNQFRGKVVLLDFWGTWCPHCIRAMPQFVDLQRRFGPRGFEVIGIAYEDDKLPQQQKVEKVHFVAQRQGVNYKVLLGAGDNCPLLNKLEVQKFPTLVLIDETGHIVWRGEGMSAQNQARVEAEIRKRLRD